jgi:hypothetical protein
MLSSSGLIAKAMKYNEKNVLKLHSKQSWPWYNWMEAKDGAWGKTVVVFGVRKHREGSHQPCFWKGRANSGNQSFNENSRSWLARSFQCQPPPLCLSHVIMCTSNS